ncbi:MAG: hypothetical protein A2Z40_05240 [Deltaproteobacteria bacterium RBG_19FT_COMBO_60_16]|nr:MAG: hypothetical protein A2Z40_05240 [Deltaproteobacteria bacterium RBG_19FT_COMBO_60_16]
MTPSAVGRRGKVLLIELTPTVPNLGRYIVMPRFGLLAIASILAEKTGYEVKLLFEPYLGTIDADRIVREDPKYILVNGLTTSAFDNKAFLSSLRERLGSRVPVIAGGGHASMFPDDARRYADFVLLYEGDETVVSLLSALEEDDAGERDQKLGSIPGLLFRDSAGVWRRNAGIRRVEKIDYRYDFRVVAGAENAVSRFRLSQIPLQTSRGCKHYCSFCSWISLYGKVGYYLRPVADVLHDVSHAIEYTGIRSFMVTDNLFGGNVAYAEELLGRIAERFEREEKKPVFTVLCRADQFFGERGVFSDKLLALMRRAGVTHVSLGLESLSPKSLVQMRKKSDVPQFLAAADRLNRNGFHIAATFVAGFDGDEYEDVVEIGRFSRRIGCFTIQVYARNIAPGTLDDMLADFRIIPGCMDKYRNGHTVNIFPSRMLPSTLQKAIFEAGTLFYDDKDPQKRLVGRVYRQVWNGIRPHYEALRRLEDEILLPERIYVCEGGNGYRLKDKSLRAVMEDPVRLGAMEKRIRSIFHAVSRKTFLDDPAGRVLSERPPPTLSEGIAKRSS